MDTPEASHEDSITMALENYTNAYITFLQANHCADPATEVTMRAAVAAMKHYMIILNERGAGMAASCALGVIRYHSEALTAVDNRVTGVDNRVTDLEVREAKSIAAGADDTPARLAMIATYMQKVTEILPVLIQRDKDRAQHITSLTKQLAEVQGDVTQLQQDRTIETS